MLSLLLLEEEDRKERIGHRTRGRKKIYEKNHKTLYLKINFFFIRQVSKEGVNYFVWNAWGDLVLVGQAVLKFPFGIPEKCC